jgi:L-ornithine Nalpha-acyltransferase
MSFIPSLYDLNIPRAGNLEVLIASRPEEIEASQRLRYQVYFEEMCAKPTPDITLAKRDMDAFDAVCDHLLVIDHTEEGRAKVVGTYRLLRSEAMKKVGRFYSDGEYDISLIRKYQGEIMEVGRSCVDANYRNRAVMQLLWRGIGAYVNRFHIGMMFGCASFVGTDPREHAIALSYLYHYHLAPDDIRPVALKDRFVEMNIIPKEAIDAKRAFVSLPTLIKGYLRLNGYIGLGAVIDPEFNTTDVGIIVKTDMLSDKYAHRYKTSDNA